MSGLELAVVAFSILLLYCIYSKYFTRVSSFSDCQSGLQLRGKVISVSDGDGFEFFHAPWLLSSEYNGEPTLSIRLAGIDAPEIGKPRFGKPAQHFSVKAKQTLEELVLDKIIHLKLLKVDQYGRILATCHTSCLVGLFNTINVNTKMVELGMAEVYKGKGAVYDDYEDDLIRLQEEAKEGKVGIWSRNDYESPGHYKKEFKN